LVALSTVLVGCWIWWWLPGRTRDPRLLPQIGLYTGFLVALAMSLVRR
jgi:hypothetical protein